MKPKHAFEPHLVLAKAVLPAGTEWAPQSTGWSFLLVTSGVAYWLHPRTTHELVPGSAMLVSDCAVGVVRASQVAEASIWFFRLNPNRLGGFLTWGELQVLARAAAQEQSAARAFPPSSETALKFK